MELGVEQMGMYWCDLMKYFILVLFLIWPSISRADIASGLQLWWKFDEGSGSTALDASGNVNSGSFVNSPAYVTGKIGPYALSFDGSTQGVTVSNSSSIDVTGAITLSMWLYPTSCASAFQIPIWKEQQFTFALQNVSGVCEISYADSSDFNYGDFGSYGNVSTNAWHLITVTKDGSNLVSIYLDGSLVTSKTYGSAITGTTNPLYVSKWPDGASYWFPGYIDDVRIYNRALLAADVAQLYAYTGKTAGFFSLSR